MLIILSLKRTMCQFTHHNNVQYIYNIILYTFFGYVSSPHFNWFSQVACFLQDFLDLYKKNIHSRNNPTAKINPKNARIISLENNDTMLPNKSKIIAGRSKQVPINNLSHLGTFLLLKIISIIPPRNSNI